MRIRSKSFRSTSRRSAPASQGFGVSRQAQCSELEGSCRLIAAQIPGELETQVLKGLEAQENEDWKTAFLWFEEANETENFTSNFFSSRMRGQLMSGHGTQVADALVASGRAAIESGDLDTAMSFDETLQSLYIGHAPSYVFSALLAREQGDTALMRTRLEQALGREPFEPEANLWMGRIEESEDNVPRALLHHCAGADTVNEAPDLHESREECTEQRARLELRFDAQELYSLYAGGANEMMAGTDELSNALCLAAVTRLIDLGGPRTELLGFRILQQARLDRFPAALTDAAEILATEDATEGQRVEAYNIISYVQLEQDNFAEAVNACLQLTALLPENLEYHARLAHARQGAQQYDEAITAYERSIELGNVNPADHLELGDCHAALEQWTEAMEAATSAMSLATEQDNLILGMKASNATQEWMAKSLEDLFGE